LIRILGASYERIEIKDLGDIIYYQQQKEYTDQQVKASKDLRREIERGTVIKLKEMSSASTSLSENAVYTPAVPSSSSSSLSLLDVKSAVTDSLKSVKEMIVSIGPIVAELVRQEISKLPSGGVTVVQAGDAVKKTEFISPEYIPTISTDGMTSNIDIKEKAVSGNDVADNLAALRKMKK
jgi:hypothetical protein